MFELKMPKLGESVTEGTIGKWLKKPGEKVNKYDLLVEVQTDKVNTEIPSPVAGTLREVEDFIASRQSAPAATQRQAAPAAAGPQAAPATTQQQATSRVVPAQPQAQSPRPAPAPSLAGDTLVPLTQMRRAIANNMMQAWSAPH